MSGCFPRRASRFHVRATSVWIAVAPADGFHSTWITHRPDLPLSPFGAERVGLGLWNSVAGTLVIESGMFVAGIVVYFACTRPKDRVGRYGVAALLALLTAFYVADRFGPPPPSERALGWFALVGGWLPVLWASWADRHRRAADAGQG